MTDLTFVSQLINPHGMYQIAFFVVRRLLQQTYFPQRLFGIVVLFTLAENASLFLRFNKQGGNRRRPDAD
jgi:hypothetical protein